MKRIIRILPHITIILSAMFITLWILDKYNPLMNFLDSDLSNALMLIFFLSSMVTAIVLVAIERKIGKKW
ncbi:MAG: hypothetical protein K0R34_3072 [Herbinix sp.]|jgi:hypothetical protein|nr:hypothetical protein [Herbinix sp.]